MAHDRTGGTWRLRALAWSAVALAGIGWAAARALRAEAAPPPAGRGDTAAADAPHAGRAERITHRGTTYDVFEIDLDSAHLRLFWRNARGERIGSLGRLRREVEREGRSLVFAMNAGMFDPSYAPLGLYVEDGRRLVELDLRRGRPGNFYLRPNGVFFVTDDGTAGILESGEFARRVPPASITLATQSGPLLLRGGAVHGAFAEGSRHRNLRNGVGVLPGNRVVFAISNQPVNLFDFALLFRERLGCRDALYLDGAVSRMYLPALGRHDAGGSFGAILAVTGPE